MFRDALMDKGSCGVGRGRKTTTWWMKIRNKNYPETKRSVGAGKKKVELVGKWIKIGLSCV